jgi:hypothetical protein
MVMVVVFALVFACALFVLLAVSGKNPAIRRSEWEARDQPASRDRMPPERLRALVTELLGTMGAEVADYPPPSPETAASQRLVALRKDPLQDVRYIVFIEAAPSGDIVEQPTVLELAEQVRYDGSLGLLVTPYSIERAGMSGLEESSVHLIDGQRLRELVAEHLPHRRAELGRYHLTGESLPASVRDAEGRPSPDPFVPGRPDPSHART